MLNKPSIAAARRFLAESKNPPESRESEDDVFKVLSWLMGGLNLARIVIYAYVLHIILTALEGGIIVATAAAAVCVLIRLDANYTFCDRLRAHPEILRWIFRRLARPANWLTWNCLSCCSPRFPWKTGLSLRPIIWPNSASCRRAIWCSWHSPNTTMHLRKMKTEKQAAYDHLMHVVCDGLNSSQRSDFVYWLPKLPIEQLAAAQKLAARDVDQCSLYLWNLIVSKKRKVAGGLEFPRAAVIPKLPKAKIRPPGLSARKKYSPRRPGPGDWSCNELNDFWYVSIRRNRQYSSNLNFQMTSSLATATG